MRTLRVRDVMTRRVVAVTPSTPFREVVELVLHRKVGAVPVLDDHGGLVGLISEADLITKQAYGDRRRQVAAGVPWVAQQEARGMSRSLGQTAREVMSAPVETALPDDTLRAVARRMVENRLRHLVVVDETRKVVGIVARRDLLRAFDRSDAELEREVTADLARCPHVEGGEVSVAVDQGVVTLGGRVRDLANVPAICRVAWLVPGVVDVMTHLVEAPAPGAQAVDPPSEPPADPAAGPAADATTHRAADPAGTRPAPDRG